MTLPLITRSTIFTKRSGLKHSTIVKLVAKNRLLEVVAMETVINCFWFKSTSGQYEFVFDMLITQKLEA